MRIIRVLIYIGLYHKLHHHHRPVTMKKSVIKRRKRVVPALQDPSPCIATAVPIQASTSPETSPADLVQSLSGHGGSISSDSLGNVGVAMLQDNAKELANTQFSVHYPPPVDFTSYRTSHNEPDASPHTTEDRVSILHPSPSGQVVSLSSRPTARGLPIDSKKRSISTAAGEAEESSDAHDVTRLSRLSSISSILNHGQPTDDDRLDPSLLALSRQQQDPTRTNGVSRHAEKRAHLEEEAERMREALRAKERELAELG